jgi:hypothetical protein
MTPAEAIMTIRDFVKTSSKWGVPGTRNALAALDSLAVEPSEKQCLTCGKQCPNDCPMEKPSEDARGLGERISTIFGVSRPQVGSDPGNDPALDSAAALITARDERIRRECADIAISWAEYYAGEDWQAVTKDSLRFAITGGSLESYDPERITACYVELREWAWNNLEHSGTVEWDRMIERHAAIMGRLE